jgi:hypothetical protein
MEQSKKKRQVIVVKKIEKVNPKKDVFISRKIRSEEDQNFENSMFGNSSPQVRCFNFINNMF